MVNGASDYGGAHGEAGIAVEGGQRREGQTPGPSQPRARGTRTAQQRGSGTERERNRSMPETSREEAKESKSARTKETLAEGVRERGR